MLLLRAPLRLRVVPARCSSHCRRWFESECESRCRSLSTMPRNYWLLLGRKFVPFAFETGLPNCCFEVLPCSATIQSIHFSAKNWLNWESWNSAFRQASIDLNGYYLWSRSWVSSKPHHEERQWHAWCCANQDLFSAISIASRRISYS